MLDTGTLLYKTSYLEDGDLDYLLTAASVIWDEYPYARQEFTKKEFIQLAHEELAEFPLITCSSNQAFAGVMVLSHFTRDMHIHGWGFHVGHIVIPHGYPGILPQMLTKLREVVTAKGGSWYNIGQRTGLLTANTRFRRVHG